MGTSLRMVAALCFSAGSAAAQQLPPAPAPSPDELLSRLLSPQAEVRIRALQLVNVPPLFLTQKDENGHDWTKASEARLLYGHYKEDRDLALVAFRLQSVYTFASVLLHTRSGWQRIGLFGCWCRYESNPLEGFVKLRPVLHAPQTEILVHDSNGGSGVWGRELSIFRVRDNRLENIYKTMDHFRNCHPTENRNYCTLQETAIDYTSLNNTPALAVARRESIEPVPPSEGQPPAQWFPPPLAVQKDVHRVGCEVLLWNEAKTSFVPSSRFTNLYCRTALPKN